MSKRSKTLAEWLAKQERGTRAKMLRAMGQHASCVERAQKGTPITFANAKRISAMTDGAVSIDTLCKGVR